MAKGVALGLGITDSLTSPTFNLVQTYDFSSGVLQHFDLYRLDSESELYDIDYFGLLDDPQAISLVEWGDKFPAALPAHYLLVNIAIADASARTVTVSEASG
jgi:tRNA threonylcarbamoyladenosine biosynthesis protein TsaE